MQDHTTLVTDANGCVTTGFVSIVNPDPIIVNVWQYENMLEATSGFVSYQWLDDQGNQFLVKLQMSFSLLLLVNTVSK